MRVLQQQGQKQACTILYLIQHSQQKACTVLYLVQHGQQQACTVLYLVQYGQTHSYTQLDESKLVFTVTSVANWGVWKNSICSEVNRNHTSDCVSIEQM